MEDADLQRRLEDMERKIDHIFSSVEKTRTYFLSVLVVSAIAFVLPLIGLMFAVPSFLSTYSNASGL